jgi:RNA polymerase sigma factor (sigma-70 family)
MHHNSNTSYVLPDDLVMSCVEPVKAIAWRFTRSSSRVDFEEFRSIGMLAVCEAAAFGGVNAPDPLAYLCKSARNAMIDEYRRLHGLAARSLDAPLSDDSELCLYDVLPTPTPPVAPALSTKSRAVYEALDHLTARQRAAIRRRYGLSGYGICNLKETAKAMHTTVGAVQSAVLYGRRSLATDYRLCKKLGLEVQA